MHKAFPLPGESSHWQYKFPLPVEGVPTARRMEIPLPGVCTAMMKKLPILILELSTKATRSAGKSTQGSKSRQTSANESAIVEEPMQTTFEMEEPSHPEFETCADDQPIVEPSQHPKWFSQQKKPPAPDRDWNKTLSATHKSIQPWISELAMPDGTLIDVCTSLDDRLKGIQMKYLSQSIWRKSDKDRAAAMIHAIDKRLKTRRIMRSLERFVEGRLYEGDFRMLQRTI
nr:hypothetical protein [Tanacetum cinerariifolium]